MPPTRALKVFLCHASVDKPAVRKLYRYLKDRKIDAWLDAEKLIGGQSWRDEIPKAIKNSDAIIVCLSKNSINKEGFVQTEIRFALDKAKEVPPGRIFLIPAKLEECDVPDELANYHWINLFEEDGYRRLMKSLRARSEQIDSVMQISDSPQEQNNLLDEEEREKTKRDAVEKAEREKAERERIERELAKERDFARKDVREKAAKEKAQREAVDEAEREAAERAAKEEAQREAVEKATRKKAEREAALKAVRNFLPKLKIPVLVLVIAFIGYLLWQGISSLTPISPIASSTETKTPQAAITATFIVIPPTKTIAPAPTGTLIPMLTPDIGSTMTGNDGMTLLYVPEGKFAMGSNSGADENPIHTVYLNAFWIDQTEVTNKQYGICVDAGKCNPPSNTDHFSNTRYANHPVVYVLWNDARTYCSWAGRRLPTEAEWEKAARGTDGRTYPWGKETPNSSLLNYANAIGDTTEVRNYPDGISPYGAYDMAGNVLEWVNDWYGYGIYNQTSPSSNPLGPDSGTNHVLRGGAWSSVVVNYVHTAYRNGFSPYNADDDGIGFRCARSQ